MLAVSLAPAVPFSFRQQMWKNAQARFQGVSCKSQGGSHYEHHVIFYLLVGIKIAQSTFYGRRSLCPLPSRRAIFGPR